jgi:hypothetical protein
MVRFWHEEGQPDWKGWVQHTRSGEWTLFRDLDELRAFFERWIEKEAGPVGQSLK